MAGGLQKERVKPVVIAVGSRSSKLPGVPTWVDAGFAGPASKDRAEMNMLLAPAGTPQNVIDTLACNGEAPRPFSYKQSFRQLLRCTAAVLRAAGREPRPAPAAHP